MLYACFVCEVFNHLPVIYMNISPAETTHLPSLEHYTAISPETILSLSLFYCSPIDDEPKHKDYHLALRCANVSALRSFFHVSLVLFN